MNHGQVHHYFGGKRGLLEAAMHHLAKRPFEHSLELAGGASVPPPLSASEDRPYFRALCQSVMDGDIELVMTVDRNDEVSAPRRVLRHLREQHPESDDLDIRANFAAIAAMRLGWFAFEVLLLMAAEVAPGGEEEFRDRIRIAMQKMIERALD